MSTTAQLIRRGVGVALAATAVALASTVPATAGSYGWPLKPFDRQHPVRAFFGDPRIAGTDEAHGAFHFGIDISATDGTPVYATATGRIVIEPVRPDVISIIDDANPRRILAYWHVVPALRNGDRAVAYRTVIGRVERPWGHVHFAEQIGDHHVNPLRPGALAPFRDATRPMVHAFSFERDGKAIGTSVRGRVDLVVEAWDAPPLAVPPPWNAKPVAPALVRWRVLGARSTLAAAPWRVAVDFRTALPATPFGSIYARWTRQNHPWGGLGRGRYRFLLARRFDATALAAGLYRVDVEVSDTRGNATRASASFRVG